MPSNEIVWIDSYDDPMFVVTRPHDDVHYFYWPYEFTLGPKILRASDVEPVKVIRDLVASRYHFYGLTIWIDPEKHHVRGEQKPIVHMMRNFHTPAAIPKGRTIQIFSLAEPPRVGLIEGIAYGAMRRIFKLYVERKLRLSGTPKGYWDRHVSADSGFGLLQ